MNINVILGTVSFVAWSIFSTWYYLNFVKNFDESNNAIEMVMEEPAPVAVLVMDEEAVEIEERALQEDPAPVEEEVAKVLSLTENFTFEINSDQMLDQSALVGFIEEVKNATQGRDVRIEITGHTCDLGSNTYNDRLGLKRAKNVENVLLTAGFDNIDVQSDGESNPLFPNDTEENRSKNRRVAISITTIS